MRPKHTPELVCRMAEKFRERELGRCPVSVNRKPRPQEPTAQYAVPVIHNTGLAWRDHARFIQNHAQKPRRPIPGGLTKAPPLVQHATIGMDEFTGLGGIRAQITDQRIITPDGQTNIPAIGLFRHRQAARRRRVPWHVTQGGAGHCKRRAGGGDQETDLVPFGVHGAVQLGTVGSLAQGRGAGRQPTKQPRKILLSRLA